MEKLHINLKEKSYDILIDESYSALPEALESIGAPKKLLVVTDSNVMRLWLEDLNSVLLKAGYSVAVCVLPAGEENKNMSGIERICSACLENKLDRSSMILALGGGVVGDMAGFAASIYMRGIRFVQLPTTVLSQSDSSVGGKTGVDFHGAKNILGAFHQPSLVFINVATIKTMSVRQFRSGIAEVIKHGIIMDADFFQFLSDFSPAINLLSLDYLTLMVKRNCEIKATVVEKDEKDLGLRAILNFGHTIGHAIESASNFKRTHGECVVFGMVAASQIAVRRGIFDQFSQKRIFDLLSRYGFETKLRIENTDEILRFMTSDKKSTDGKLKFILPTRIGSVVTVDDVTEPEIKNALKFIKKDDFLSF